jgi:DNA repair exonuclease SbcCD ATPase subunit
MIKQLTLKNWRSYEDATIPFGPGTTFVIAPNGVGKTSLVEAARWVLFGKITGDGRAAIRAGTDTATASVQLELPDNHVLSVERTLTIKPRNISPVIHLDGTPLTEAELHQRLSNAYRTEPTFLAGLTMPAIDHDKNKPSALGLEEHLGRYYGVDGLKTAIDQLKTMLKETVARINRTKTANSASAQRLSQLQADVELAASRSAEAAEVHRVAQTRVDKAREHERLETETQRWHADNAAWEGATSRLAARVSAELGLPVPADHLQEALEQRLSDLDKRIEKVRVDVAVNNSKAQALTANQERLDVAFDDCPVCRRPLDDATVASAHEANLHELSALHDSTHELRTTEAALLAQREQTKATQAEWRQIPRPGKPPQSPSADYDEHIAATELASMAEDTLSNLVEARAKHLKATEAVREAQTAHKAMRELESLFKQQASLTVAIDATEATLTELLDDTIRPLASEVNQRWQALFPNRGDLSTSSSGNITRTVNEHPLPYDSFSTGESMGATILLKLLVAQMATTANFCWFDEPLEHLDPAVRRRVANLLSRATGGEGRLRQVVVTTYEEPLARKLRARDEQRVTLLDVRQKS